MLIDDKSSILSRVALLIEARGHPVCQARDGDEAVDLFQVASRSSKPIDLVMLDLTIPGDTGGRETMAQLTASDPGVEEIVSSGNSAIR